LAGLSGWVPGLALPCIACCLPCLLALLEIGITAEYEIVALRARNVAIIKHRALSQVGSFHDRVPQPVIDWYHEVWWRWREFPICINQSTKGAVLTQCNTSY